MSTYAEIRECETNLEVAKGGYLRAHGWSQTSTTPGSYWMWRRDFGDVNARRLAEHEAFCKRIKQQREHHSYPQEMLADTDTAIRMTWAEIDPRCNDFADECD